MKLNTVVMIRNIITTEIGETKMTSSLFTKMGLANLDIAYLFIIQFVLIIALIVIVIIQIVKNNKLTKRYEAFMQGEEAISLEEEIHNLVADVRYLGDTSQIHTQDIDTLFYKQESNFQKLGLIKYDAFKESGGKLSYVLALLDENNNGYVINSVRSSMGSDSYAKRIKRGNCDIELSKEEKVALSKAMNEVRN